MNELQPSAGAFTGSGAAELGRGGAVWLLFAPFLLIPLAEHAAHAGWRWHRRRTASAAAHPHPRP